MTKKNLKNIIQEIIKEMDYPVSTEDLPSNEKIKKKLEAWKRWGEKMQLLRQIHQELGVELQKMISASEFLDAPYKK